MTRCEYSSKFFDYDKKEPALFECDEEVKGTRLCSFHSIKNNNEEEKTRKLIEKIKDAKSKDAIFCVGYNIKNIQIDGSFSKSLYFTKSIIQNADFSGSKFKNADFSGAKFKNADFSSANFEAADFLAVEFKEKANFSNTVFRNKVNFSESVFNDANFSNSSLKKAQFIGTKFKTTDFGHTKIEDSDFFGAVFEKKAMFIGANILGTRFQNASFEGNANFTGATLNKTNFRETKFNEIDFGHTNLKVVLLQGIVVNGNVNFSASNMEKVDFFNADLKKNIDFTESILENVLFSNSKFKGHTIFVKTNFGDNVKFLKMELEDTDFSDAKFKGKTFFHDVTFKNQNQVIFNVENLSKVSFRNTDLTRIRFGDKVKWGGNDGYTILDEEMLKKPVEIVALEGVIATYRNLQKNYELRFRTEEANKFLAKVIKLKKLYKQEDLPQTISDYDILTNKLVDLEKNIKQLRKTVQDLEEQIKNKKNFNEENE